MTESGGTARSWLGRAMGEGDNPILWSLSLGKIGGVAVRLHLIFVVWAVLRLVRTIPEDNRGAIFELGWLCAVAVVVGVQQAGAVLAMRRLPSTEDHVAEQEPIVLWPLGNLLPPSRGGASASAAALGTLATHAMLVPVLGGLTLLLTGGWAFVLFNPLEFQTVESLVLAENGGLVVWFVWLLHAVNLAVLAAHLLLPMLPMSAGVLLRSWLGRRDGPGAVRLAAGIGMLVALVLGGIGWAAETVTLVGIAAVGFFVCWQEQRRESFLESLPEIPEEDSTRPEAGADAEVDRILEKISRSGLASLSKKEKRTLDAASAETPENERSPS